MKTVVLIVDLEVAIKDMYDDLDQEMEEIEHEYREREGEHLRFILKNSNRKV
jgi:hypothetical protein